MIGLAFGWTYFGFAQSKQRHRHLQNLFYSFNDPFYRRNNIVLIPRRLQMTFSRIQFFQDYYLY